MPLTRPSNPQIVAHRGYHDGCVENSLQAFCQAFQERIPWCECDVWPSSDGSAIVIHDETLDRTTVGVGRVRDHRSTDLYRLLLRYPDGRISSDQQIPSLADVAALLPHTSSPGGLLVEIKPSDSRQFVQTVLSTLQPPGPHWMLQSFDPANLLHAQAIDPRVPLALLVEDRPSLERGISEGWKRIHLLHDLLDEPTARHLHSHGISIGVWTVNTPDDLRHVMSLGAAMIITDEPLLAMEVAGGRR